MEAIFALTIVAITAITVSSFTTLIAFVALGYRQPSIAKQAVKTIGRFAPSLTSSVANITDDTVTSP